MVTCRTEAQPAAGTRPDSPPATITSMPYRILLVEDDNRLSTLITGYLRKHDYEVETVLDGHAAVPAILSSRPDLVLLDVNLPGKDGFEICREARKHFDGVIVMVTARDEPYDPASLLDVFWEDLPRDSQWQLFT